MKCLQNDSNSNLSKPKFLHQHVFLEQLLFHHNFKAFFRLTSFISSLSVPASLFSSFLFFFFFIIPRSLDSCLSSFTISLHWRVSDQTDLSSHEVEEWEKMEEEAVAGRHVYSPVQIPPCQSISRSNHDTRTQINLHAPLTNDKPSIHTDY